MNGLPIALQSSAAAQTAVSPAAAQSGGVDPGEFLLKFLKPETLEKIIGLALVIVIGFVLVRLAVFVTQRLTRRGFSPHTATLLKKAVGYTGFILVTINAFDVAGVDLTALLGAAGIAGIAIGFAAQTSFANVISGIFMLSEKAFAVGDVIEIGDAVGVVESIDMLSVKMQTFDNRLVRIPNENLIKSNVINLTRYPIRRLDIEFTVTFDSPIEAARDALLEAAENNRFALKNPEPFFMVAGYAQNGVSIFFGVWFRQERFIEMKNSIYLDIKRAFDERGVKFALHAVAVEEKKTALKTKRRQ